MVVELAIMRPLLEPKSHFSITSVGTELTVLGNFSLWKNLIMGTL